MISTGNPDKNIPKLEHSYFSSKFYVESEFGMPQLPSFGQFYIFDDFWRPLFWQILQYCSCIDLLCYIINLILVSTDTGFDPGMMWSVGRGITTDLHCLMYASNCGVFIFPSWTNIDFNGTVQRKTEDRILASSTYDWMDVAAPHTCILIFSFHFISYHIISIWLYIGPTIGCFH